MQESRSLPIGTLFLVIVIALAVVGVGYGLWSQSLFIRGRVQTGDVRALFRGAFTDDDGTPNDPGLDAGDNGDCPVSSATGPSSCDPAASGPDPKPRYDKDVGRCVAEVLPDGTTGVVTKTEVYPGYFCTSWFGIHNSGTVPVKIASAELDGQPVDPGSPTPFDLTGDGEPDVAIHLTGVEICEQIDPDQTVLMDLDQQILDAAPQGTTLSYTVEVKLIQWNEECAQPELEIDQFPEAAAQVGLELPDGTRTFVSLRGPVTVHVQLGELADASRTEPGEPDGQEQVPTEIVAMRLTGESPLGPVTVRLRDPSKHPFERSLGEIEENNNANPGILDVPPFAAAADCPGGCTADSFFDVFFELEVDGTVLHNSAPLRMEATITHKPPDPGNRYHSPDGTVTPLLDEGNNPSGFSLFAATLEPVVSALPDLTVQLSEGPTSVECIPGTELCLVFFGYTVSNPSAVDVTGPFTIELMADQAPPVILTMPGLPAGSSESRPAVLGPGGDCYDPDCTVSVEVDIENLVEESDETNNSDTRTDPRR